MAFRKKAKKVAETFQLEQREEPMGGGEEMRNLCQEIASSFDARVAKVAALRQETAATLKGFRQAMKNLQHELRRSLSNVRRSLSNAEASRMRNFRAMHQDIRARQEERNREVASTLGGFRREREAAGAHWQDLAATMAKRRVSFAR